MAAELQRDGKPVFGRYAGFYDALYEDKDYEAECDFLVETFALSEKPVHSVLDLGSGTGGHDIPLAKRGFEVVGADRSLEMVGIARQKAEDAGVDALFEVGDVKELNLGRTFDAVISMFAVICYLVGNDDLLAMMQTARRHLEPGGIFVFDAWFGPAVLVQKPEDKTRRIEQPDGDVIERQASPVFDLMTHSVEVRYNVRRTRGGDVIEETRESHQMRFLFPQEINHFLDLAGFDLVAIGPFMDFSVRPTEQDWNVSVVARAR